MQVRLKHQKTSPLDFLCSAFAAHSDGMVRVTLTPYSAVPVDRRWSDLMHSDLAVCIRQTDLRVILCMLKDG